MTGGAEDQSELPDDLLGDLDLGPEEYPIDPEVEKAIASIGIEYEKLYPDETPAAKVDTTAKGDVFIPSPIAVHGDDGLTPLLPDILGRRTSLITARRAGRDAPGCFGSIGCFNPAREDCRVCKFFAECGSVAAQERLLVEPLAEARRLHFKTPDRKSPEGIAARQRLNRLMDGIRDHYLAKYKKALDHGRERDRAYQSDKRANPTAGMLIERESQERMAALRFAIASRRNDKRLQQLRGREVMIELVWEAEQFARINHGPAASAARVAQDFNEMVGFEGYLSRSQVRGYQLLFENLEQSPHVWKRFVKSPGSA